MRTQKRPGVLLLIVLALLAMFGVMAIAFVILTGTTRRGADALRKVGQYDDQPEKVLNQTLLEVVRGSNNHQSPFQAHGLLENLYGNEWFTGTISNATPVVQGQLIQFSFSQVTPQPPTSAPPPPVTPPNKQMFAEQHLGAVLTVIGPASSPLVGCSTHIVAGLTTGITAAQAPQAQFQIAAFEGTNLTPAQMVGSLNGCSCLINSMPYSGTGFGFDPQSVAKGLSCYNTATDTTGWNGTSGWQYQNQAPNATGWEFALLPNHAAFPYKTTDPGYSSTYVSWLSPPSTIGQPVPDPAGPGGANPDYTAPDYQNMFLALRLTNGTTLSPSFHRPELVNFWMNRSATSKPGNATSNIAWFDPLYGPILQRKVLQRPLAVVRDQNHNVVYNFNPGIPDLPEQIKVSGNWVSGPLITGPLDVDNDGDGIADSVWIDPGYEVRSTPDGRLYKPLVAVLCVDLDGRLNLNAHGSLAQLLPVLPDFYQSTNSGSTLLYGGNPPKLDVQNGNGQTAVALPHGHMGWGPADINLSSLFANNLAEYRWLLQGNAAVGAYGRYVANPGSGSAVDDLDANKEFDYPINYSNTLGANAMGATGPMGYGTPPDLQGMLAVGIDYRGQPFYGVPSGGAAVDPIANNPGGTWASSSAGCYAALAGNWNLTGRAANPYELDLSLGQPRGVRPSAPYSPFSVAELEPILRPFDRDAMTLPNRLLKLSPMCLGNASSGAGAKVTVEGWDLPCPNLAAPVNLLNNAPTVIANPATPPNPAYIPDGRIRHFTDLLKAAGVSPANMASILPPDILAGLRMDINRPFGNGLDDNNNGIIDDPFEAAAVKEPMPYVSPSAGAANYRMDFANTGTAPGTPSGAAQPSPPPVDPRQMLFRYLFVLGMILTDPNATPPNGFASTNAGVGLPNLGAMSIPSSLAPPAGVTLTVSGQAEQQLELRARWIAQWAANVVSFRDRDSIMKAFAFDPYFLVNSSGGAWNYNNWMASDNGQHVVFSCERPELLISETLAFHQTRTEIFNNPNYDKTKQPPDPNNPQYVLLQRMKPVGSLYIELFNPWGATEAPPAEFYFDRTATAKGWQEGVVLNQTAPATNPITQATQRQDPVWRLIIPAGDGKPATTPPAPPPDPDSPPCSTTIAAVVPERAIYFTNPNSLSDNAKIQHYPSGAPTNVAAPMVLLHNHYALVGPPNSETTNAGTWLSAPSSAGGTTPTRIVLSPSKYDTTQNQTTYQNPTSCPVQILYNGATTPGANDLPVQQLKQPLPIVIDQVSSGGANPPRLSISEPLAGYPPTTATDSATSTGDATYSATTPPTYSADLFQPLDGTTAQAATGLGQASPTQPVTINGTTTVGTLTDNSPVNACRVVHLQRLANPLLAYDANPAHIYYITGTNTQADGQIDWTRTIYNPYLTIDSMPIDLNVYNGWTTASDLKTKVSVTEPVPTPAFKSRQRGDYMFWNGGGTNFNNLWAQECQSGTMLSSYPGGAPLTSLNNQYNYQLQHTLGYINRPYWAGAQTSYTANTAISQEYQGDPPTPFPWFTWNNRPFCSPMELMLVPATSSSQLLYNYGVIGNPAPTTYTVNGQPITIPMMQDAAGVPAQGTNPYSPQAQPNGIANQPFTHLMNFFYSSAPSNTPWSASQPNPLPVPPQFYRILEYLRVPSRFVGTEIQANPAACGDTSGNTHLFHPPYNRISRYRDPGRMNLNTLIDPDVWNGLMQSAPGLNLFPPTAGTASNPTANPPAFGNFVCSRRGYGTFSGTVADLSTATPPLPTRFANPFRSFAGSHLVPLRQLVQTGDINSTLLRQDPSNLNRPLFGFDGAITASAGSSRPYNNDEQDPYFRYQNLQRLGNLTTTRSNVFAVWITVGYFQVQKVPAQGQTGCLPANLAPYQQFFYPDGYQIIGELGADTGEVKRHRAFYIFDRSIPMGFQRGNDNNVTSGILLSRMIE